MPCHPKATTEKLHRALQERFDRLVAAMYGSDVSDQDIRMRGLYGSHVRVSSEDVRIGVDDFATILKEIKTSLGKR